MSGLADVSVIVPAYNSEQTIQRALSSVVLQTVRPKEIVLVDDGSDDGTLGEVEGFRERLGGIDLIVEKQENQGPGAARNAALRLSNYDVIAFLDADDEWVPEKLENSLRWMSEGAPCLVAHNGWLVQDGAETYLDIAARFRASSDQLFHGMYKRGFISTSSVVARKPVVLACGGFDQGLRTGQDFDLWLRLLDDPKNTLTVHELPLTKYHIRPNSVTRQTAQRLKDTLKIANRHAPRLKRHSGRPWASVLFRIAALHAEAANGYWRNSKWWSAAKVIFQFPFCLVTGIRVLYRTDDYSVDSPFS
jgi:teichuronic acid biosynthesis glycosyltransferase TuaG